VAVVSSKALAGGMVLVTIIIAVVAGSYVPINTDG
jgi:hypothetical protein